MERYRRANEPLPTLRELGEELGMSRQRVWQLKRQSVLDVDMKRERTRRSELRKERLAPHCQDCEGRVKTPSTRYCLDCYRAGKSQHPSVNCEDCGKPIVVSRVNRPPKRYWRCYLKQVTDR